MDEAFAIGNSLIHRIDPRVKIVCAALFSVVAATADRLSTLITALFFATILIFISRLNIFAVGVRLKAILFFLLLMWLVLPISHGGSALFAIGPLTASRPGIILAAQISLKAVTILLVLIALTATMPFATTGQALHYLKVPNKMIFLVLMTYRYIFVIEQEFARLLRAARVRGFLPKTRWHTYRTYAYMIGMLFVRASVRAQRVHHAMLCRGFKGRFYGLTEFTITLRDLAFLVVFSAGIGLLLWLQWIDKGILI